MPIELRLKHDGDLNVHDFKDISTEIVRTYYFPDGETVTIEEPQWLHVSRSGGHRILDLDGLSHYVPKGWIHLCWTARPESPHFAA